MKYRPWPAPNREGDYSINFALAGTIPTGSHSNGSRYTPFADTGNPGPVWFSFDVTPKRLEGGGWTHQVTERELSPSTDLAGVNMRLKAGSFRELHWSTADEWATSAARSA